MGERKPSKNRTSSSVSWLIPLVGGVVVIALALRSAHYTYGAARTSPLDVTFTDVLLGVGLFLLIGMVVIFRAGYNLRGWLDGKRGAAHRFADDRTTPRS